MKKEIVINCENVKIGSRFSNSNIPTSLVTLKICGASIEKIMEQLSIDEVMGYLDIEKVIDWVEENK